MPHIDRRDHVWIKQGNRYKCVACGAVTAKKPPHPTPRDWMPEFGYEPLTDAEREQAPRQSKPA